MRVKAVPLLNILLATVLLLPGFCELLPEWPQATCMKGTLAPQLYAPALAPQPQTS